jgi:hypothetical protein
MDEACLLRGVGDRGVMRAQLAKLAEAAGEFRRISRG